MRSSRALVALALLCVIPTTTGCSAIGMGLGAAIGDGSPRYSSVAPNDPLLVPGKHVRVVTGTEGVDAQKVEGVYAGEREDALVVSNASGDHAIASRAIRELGVRNGTHWGTGFAVGLVIGCLVDSALVIATVASINHSGFGRL